MASSQVEILSSSTFGCVLRDRNQRDCNNTISIFQKNFDDLVGDHFFPRIDVDEPATMGLSQRQSRFLDGWAARQAQETSSTIERKPHEAEIQALSNSQVVTSRTSALLRETSPASSDTSVDLAHVVGASSLVRMWEARLNRLNAFNLNSNTSSTITAESGDSRTNSGLSDDDDNNNAASSQIDGKNENNDKRIKVSDMVKKLTSDETNNHTVNVTIFEQNNARLPRIKARFAAFDQQADQENFLQVGKSPRIRGRQAFNDLLMQMERDRHRELQHLVERRAVSGFRQRGHIQAMLRLRFLRRGVAIQERRQCFVSNYPLSRDSFNMRVEHGDREVSINKSGSCNPRMDMEILSPASSQICEDASYQNQQRVASTRNSSTCASEVFHEEASSITDFTWQEEASNFEAHDSLDTQDTQYQNIWDENETAHDDDVDNVNQHIMGNDYDWFRGISRPRVHWEDRRRAWYQEMLDSDSNNGEIKQLLERRRVSTCLASDFRHRIDQLMVSRLNQQTQPDDRKEEEESLENAERMGQFMMSLLQRQRMSIQEHVDEEHDEDAIDEKYEEQESSMGQQYQEAGDYFSQTSSSVQLPLPSPISSSWSSYRDQQVKLDYDQAAPTLSLTQSPQSQSYYHERRISSTSTNHFSLKKELINDLRGHMEQLQREMTELKNTIKSCIDMQLQLQHSFKQEDHSVEGLDNKSANKGQKKGNCCICYEMKVDSLLYRCGHMCTCLKCAHELRWSSGKCPICRAPIVDVVRAFPHS